MPNKVLGLKGTTFDAYTKWVESNFADISDMRVTKANLEVIIIIIHTTPLNWSLELGTVFKGSLAECLQLALH